MSHVATIETSGSQIGSNEDGKFAFVQETQGMHASLRLNVRVVRQVFDLCFHQNFADFVDRLPVFGKDDNTLVFAFLKGALNDVNEKVEFGLLVRDVAAFIAVQHFLEVNPIVINQR
jgi:hypothetical protein